MSLADTSYPPKPPPSEMERKLATALKELDDWKRGYESMQRQRDRYADNNRHLGMKLSIVGRERDRLRVQQQKLFDALDRVVGVQKANSDKPREKDPYESRRLYGYRPRGSNPLPPNPPPKKP